MRILIGEGALPSAFTEGWLEVARNHGWEWKKVDPFALQVLDEVKQADGFFWHLNHLSAADVREGPRIVETLGEQGGAKVFPNRATARWFDDKAGQAFGLRAIGAPTPETFVYFDEEAAHRFLDQASFPLVAKLRRGASAENVMKLDGPKEARRLVRRVFGRGLPVSKLGVGAGLKMGARGMATVARSGSGFRSTAARALRFVRARRGNPKERDCIIFQEFVRGCTYDIRITIIGGRAFAYRRHNRPNDFRASGSGRLQHLEPELVPQDILSIAFDISERLGLQSMAFDFIRRPETEAPLLVEMCYVYVSSYVSATKGYFTSEGGWIPGHYMPEAMIMEDLLGVEIDAEVLG